MRGEQKGVAATLQGSSSPERHTRWTRRRVLIIAAVAAILVGVVIGWLAYAVLAEDATPLSGAVAGVHRPEAVLIRTR